MKEYHINLFYSEEDEAWIADFPDLQFCSAFGSTPQEALEEALVAKKAWIETALSVGRVIPPANYKPEIYHTG